MSNDRSEEDSQPDSDATEDQGSQGDVQDDDDERIAFASNEWSQEAPENVNQDILEKYQEVDGEEFPLLRLPPSSSELIQDTWQAFLKKYSSREFAGEAIFDAIMEEAPTLQNLFKMARSVFGIRFTMSLTNIIGSCNDPAVLKRLVETLGFQHMDLEVTTARVAIIRDCIHSVVETELGVVMDANATLALKALLNYIGGAFIYVKREYAGRIRIIQRSWRIANRHGDQAPGDDAEEAVTGSQLGTVSEDVKEEENEEEDLLDPQDNDEVVAILQASGDMQSKNAKVPSTFSEMFLFNAAVMGFSESKWMKLVLARLEDLASNVANSPRIQEECDVLSLVLAKYKGVINLSEFKAVMLASLRSVVPQDWDMDHETAWTWLWETVERMLKSMMGTPITYEKALRNWLGDISEETRMKCRNLIFSKLFKTTPAAQDYLKQSTGRLHFIADRILEMSLDLYVDPLAMVDEISALGLRHVGYGVPTELFQPLVLAYVEALEEASKRSEKKSHVQAFRWSLTLISKMLIRVITEGSTVVMKAINTNHELALRKAVSIIPRGRRAADLLNVSCGTQSISPLYWAIDSGSLNCAKAIIEDLLTIRADRDVYYYGCDALFTRHPDLIHQMCLSAPTLLQPLLDGLVWRSRNTVEGKRRVNYYVKHLVQDLDGNFSETLSWLVEYQDPHVVSHPAAALAADVIWFRFAVFYFLRGRCYLLFTLCIFIAGQAVLGKRAGEESFEENVAIFSCRCFLYFGSMCQLLYTQVKLCYVDIKRGTINRSYIFPIPEYLFDVQQALYMTLVCALIVMFFLEPILWCIKDSTELGLEMNNATGTYIFTENCPEAQDMGAYYIFSCLAMLLYWALLVDFAVISMRLSAFVLVCSRVMSEVGLLLIALSFLIVAFSTAISSLNHSLLEYDGVDIWLGVLLRICLGMFPASDYVRFKDEVPVFVAVSAFVAVVFVTMLNLLVAQLTESYHSMFKDMQGYARLNRASVVVSVMVQATQKRWSRFLNTLGFEDRLEFNQGDIGFAGGIQILEPANASSVTTESIKRYGGSTAPTMPWPEDEGSVEEDRLERLEKLIMKRNKRSGGSGRKMTTSGPISGVSVGSNSSGGQSAIASE